MPFFAKEIQVDQYGKATNFRLHSLKKPHMRALHMAWLSFMVAFIAWYSIPPLISYIEEDLRLTASQVYDSNVVAVTATIVARSAVGPFCERFGPRRVIAALLLAGSIPCAMTGLLQNAQGLVAVRLFIGVLGAIFVPCELWMTQMFSPSVVGAANAMAAGWGNMGAGITYLVMPAIFGGVRRSLPLSKAWRVVFVIPASICILVAIMILLFATDTPHGDWLEAKDDAADHGLPSMEKKNCKEAEEPAIKIHAGKTDNEDNEVETAILPADDEDSIADVRRNESALSALQNFFKVLTNPAVLITASTYACSLGVELAVDNVIGSVYEKEFHVNPSTASYVGSIFGLLNICSCISGGLFSDYMARRFHIPGRILALLIGMVLEGVFLLSFSFGLKSGSLSTSIVLMVFFSFFIQAVCGLTFGIVPFVDPVNNGKVMGIVGAAGSLGGLMFNIMFLGFGTRYSTAFLCLGGVALVVATIGTALLRVQNKTIWHLFHNRHP